MKNTTTDSKTYYPEFSDQGKFTGWRITEDPLLLRHIPKGEHFRLKDSETAKVYVKEAWCRSEKKFHATDCTDIWGNGRMLKPTTIVFVGFTY